MSCSASSSNGGRHTNRNNASTFSDCEIPRAWRSCRNYCARANSLGSNRRTHPLPLSTPAIGGPSLSRGSGSELGQVLISGFEVKADIRLNYWNVRF